MLQSTYIDHARVLNLVLLILCIAGLTANMVVRWRIVNRRTRRVLLWIYLIFLNFAYGYTIAIRTHQPFNLSVLIASVLLSGLLVALLWHPEGDDRPLFHDNSLGTRFLVWLDNQVRAYHRWREERHMEQKPNELPDQEELVPLPVEGPIGEMPVLPPEPGSVSDMSHGISGDEEELPESDADDEEGTEL